MNPYTYTPHRVSPQKKLVLQHKKRVKEKTIMFARMIFFVLMIIGLFTIVLGSASKKQVAKDCTIEKQMLVDYPEKGAEELLIKECKERGLW